MGERPAMAELKSRQWSCETLSRGISYLNHQQASVKKRTKVSMNKFKLPGLNVQYSQRHMFSTFNFLYVYT
jgi:hypothetical protein